MPVFNEGRDSLHSVAALLHEPDLHEVVVADASTATDSRECIDALLARAPAHGWPRLQVLRGVARGRAFQMNAGARQARGDVLLFLHADTRLPPEAAGAIRQALTKGFRWGRFDVRLDDPRRVFRTVEAAMNVRSALSGIATGDQAIFVERELFRRLGGYANIPLMEDIELSRRLKPYGRPARIRSRVHTSARRWQAGGVVRTILQMWGLRLMYWLGVAPQRLASWYGNPR